MIEPVGSSKNLEGKGAAPFLFFSSKGGIKRKKLYFCTLFGELFIGKRFRLLGISWNFDTFTTILIENQRFSHLRGFSGVGVLS